MELSYQSVRYQSVPASTASVLSYRGVRYQATQSMIETVETKQTGKYRGVPMRFHSAKILPSVASFGMKYRGCQY
uniref:DUF4278 domain-containing protein n=1 Tax=Oscillatoriales cyanobacterium SpSt-402 TaxID=2282168 RepID=A0A832H1C2_9CYAN